LHLVYAISHLNLFIHASRQVRSREGLQKIHLQEKLEKRQKRKSETKAKKQFGFTNKAQIYAREKSVHIPTNQIAHATKILTWI